MDSQADACKDNSNTSPADYTFEQNTIALASRCRTIPPKDLSVLQGMRQGRRPTIQKLGAVYSSLKREIARERRDRKKTWIQQALRRLPKQKQSLHP